MNDLRTHLDPDDVLTLLNRTTGFLGTGSPVETPEQGVNNQTYLVREAGLVVKIRSGGGPPTVPCPHWPAHTCALLGEIPNGGVRSLAAVTELLRRHGGLPVSRVVHLGEGTGPDSRDFTVGEILPGRPFDGEANRMGRRAAGQLGEHLGRFHAATARIDGFGIFGEAPVRWNRWWNRFALSYGILADAACAGSPALRGFQLRLNVPLEHATRSPDPRAFPLVCVDQNPSHYLGDERGNISGFVNPEGHVWAPAEWELTTVLLWMPHPHAFREGYERFRRWPETMDAVCGAYTTYTLMERLLRTRDQMDRPREAANLEAWIVGTLA